MLCFIAMHSSSLGRRARDKVLINVRSLSGLPRYHDGGVCSSFRGAVSIGSFEVSRWRDGRGDLPMGFQSEAGGFCRVLDWRGERIELRGGWFRRKRRPKWRLQMRFVRFVAVARAHAGTACASTTAWRVDDDFGSGEFLMNCQHCISLAGQVPGLDGSKVGRR
jgi:hypothetical protein